MKSSLVRESHKLNINFNQDVVLEDSMRVVELFGGSREDWVPNSC